MTSPKDKTILRLLAVQKLIEQRKFKQALPLAEELMHIYPDDPMVYSPVAICYSRIGDAKRSLDLLRTARQKFPKNYDILYYLAETLNQLEQYENSEKVYRDAIGLTPKEFKQERSQCYNGLGVSLWEQRFRKEALDAWKLAIKENPRNVIARKNLAECTNEYNEPAAPSSLHNDLYHFQKIQSELYFSTKGITAFNSPEEAQRVLSIIMCAWNKHLAPRGAEMDKMSPAEKTEIFKAVKIDFE